MKDLSISAVILAGGRGQRMGGVDKGLVSWQKKPLIEYAIAAIEPQVDQLILSCNRNIEAYTRYGFPVISDDMDNFQGPLSGVISVLDSNVCSSQLLLLYPCDCPNPPSNLVQALTAKLVNEGLDCAYCSDGLRDQYLLSLISTDCKESLRSYLNDNKRSVHGWFETIKTAAVYFTADKHQFLNLNLEKELELYKSGSAHDS